MTNISIEENLIPLFEIYKSSVDEILIFVLSMFTVLFLFIKLDIQLIKWFKGLLLNNEKNNLLSDLHKYEKSFNSNDTSVLSFLSKKYPEDVRFHIHEKY